MQLSLAEEHVDVETLEREAQAAENVSAEAEGEFSYKDLKGLTFAFSSGAGAWGTILTIQEDGSFEGNVKMHIMEDIKRCKVVTELHKKVAKCEMVSHEMVDGNPEIQRTMFSDGTKVTVDFGKQIYSIEM